MKLNFRIGQDCVTVEHYTTCFYVITAEAGGFSVVCLHNKVNCGGNQDTVLQYEEQHHRKSDFL